ncbi:putative NADP-dependent alcohol dehydrogenase C 2 [Acephala macrosclerotiorum]|nr:putative NADP-dependent alcohol dehydrogenase C 2 [Acephala macrosclerotiorum]
MPSFTVFKGSQDGKILQSTTTREVKADKVMIKVSHSGVCGTDLHFLNKDIVLGHEGVGTIIASPPLIFSFASPPPLYLKPPHLVRQKADGTQELGKDVLNLKEGDTAGWNYVQSSCLSCAPCLSSPEQLCPTASLFGTSNLDQGSFATHGIWKASFVYKIPEGMEPKYAVLLMCGGATVFHTLRSLGVGPGERVGIVGVGGLGHLAIQFASKMGCEAVVFSEKKLAHLIITSSQPPDWGTMLKLMAPKGVIYPLTVNEGTLPMPYRALIRLELRVQGSRVSPRDLHGVRPIVEEFPMSREGIEEAMRKLNSGRMRYRGVLVI